MQLMQLMQLALCSIGPAWLDGIDPSTEAFVESHPRLVPIRTVYHTSVVGRCICIHLMLTYERRLSAA